MWFLRPDRLSQGLRCDRGDQTVCSERWPLEPLLRPFAPLLWRDCNHYHVDHRRSFHLSQYISQGSHSSLAKLQDRQTLSSCWLFSLISALNSSPSFLELFASSCVFSDCGTWSQCANHTGRYRCWMSRKKRFQARKVQSPEVTRESDFEPSATYLLLGWHQCITHLAYLDKSTEFHRLDFKAS